MKTEIWKSHPYISGIEVSTLGNVQTIDRVISGEKRTRFTKGRVLKQNVINSGYLRVCFRVNGKVVSKLVHRLVAETFIKNPNNLQGVNHKDGDKTNNEAGNLKWCYSSYKSKVSSAGSKGVPVLALNLSTLEVSKFPSQNEARKFIGIDRINIINVIKGRQKTASGYWFVNADDNAIDIAKSKIREIGKTKLASSDAAIADFIRQVNNF